MGLSTPFNKFLKGSATIDVGSLVDGAGSSHDITVTGAVVGDFVLVSADLEFQAITVTGHVRAANIVEVRVQNETTATIDLASTTFNALVLK